MTVSELLSHDLTPAVLSVIAVVFSFFALAIRASSYKQQIEVIKRQEEMNFIALFNDANRRLREIQSGLPSAVNEEGWNPDASHRRLIQIYWYTVFDVWAITNKFSHGTKALWNDFYLNGVKSALKIEAFAESFEEMAGIVGFMGHKEAFIAEIKRAQNESNKSMQPTDSPQSSESAAD